MDQAQAISCAENIALLHLLHAVPTRPSKNPNKDLSGRKPSNYSLSFETERKLSYLLASISSVTEKIDHIPAVCIREDARTKSLHVLLAVNQAKFDDCKSLMEKLKAGFSKLFLMLSKVENATKGPATVTSQSDILGAIIEMCSGRIICRLRLTKKSSLKPPLSKRLQSAIGLVSHESANQFVEAAKLLDKQISSYTKHRTLEELQLVIEAAYQLGKKPHFSDCVDSIMEIEMERSAKTALLDTIQKLSRYKQTARFLHSAAKKDRLLRTMKLVPVRLPDMAFRNDSPLTLNPSLLSALRRGGWPSKEKNIRRVCDLLKVTQEHAKKCFVDQTIKSFSQSKVHAEIQLIYHCEVEGFQNPPRVICSSKDACYLCNLFIGVVGKFHTPRSHGRLHPAWKLPVFPQPSDLPLRLNTLLEEKIQSSICTMLQRRAKTIYPFPNESTILTLPVSTSTLASLICHSEHGEGIIAAQLPLASDIARLETGDSILQSAASHSTEIIGTIQQDYCNSLSESDDHEPCEPAPSQDQLVSLTKGVKTSAEVIASRSSPIYEAWPLQVQVEKNDTATKPSCKGENLPSIHFSIEWLSEEEARQIRRENPRLIIDAGSMESEVTIKLGDSDNFFIAARDAMVRMCMPKVPLGAP
ncbi:hypothetical protein QQS21_007160 [Conoideocrella luteorostrata]|uniref:Uncharacterized protein n=1 Tax=Conoideocrella luteorostrata TaxID=1105319 RepID=A0AAJ0CLD6_9HYPO|nr:hypothetical protein QQS21_007160 [Conoideocrella luteorostrata]